MAKFKHILTEEDFDNNPELVDEGFNVGDEVEIEVAVADIGPRPGDKNKD